MRPEARRTIRILSSPSDRAQAGNEYNNASERLYEALREAKLQEHDGLWSDVLEAVLLLKARLPVFRVGTTRG